ncbi:MAG: serine/threonine protein kinase [Labilithrix sp.]|nr:serine/threonine protein kinase [Labilithrix sp.]MCW5810563.1 serine/threonine protein kinase [Labilithrix sp.]
MTDLRDGRYTLVRRLGEGSQGETWEAIDRGAARGRTGTLTDQWRRYVERAGEKPAKPSAGERVVAIKAFRLGKAKAWKDVELAEREARTLASLDHEKLPHYVEHFEEDGTLYLVMEKIEGESLASLRKAGRTLGPGDVRRLLEDAADALGYLHARAPAIVHRDIKPGNVIRRSDGSFAIVDFGAVRDRLKPEGGSTVVGTFGYMAPEQFQGRASPKSDVYGLGATALSMLTGCEPEELPHEGLAIVVAKSVPPHTPAGLVAALEAMLEPDPDRRASSVAEALALFDEEKPRKKKRARPSRKNRERRRREAKLERLAKKSAASERPGPPREPLPLFPRIVARLGLFVALTAVWMFVGVLVPLVLTVLSLLFGEPLRAAARRAIASAKRAGAAIGRTSARVSGRTAPPPRLRIRTDLDRARAVTEEQAQRIAIDEAESHGEDADEWLEEKIATETRRWEEEERKRARMRDHARPPPKGKHWGR